MKAIPSSGSHWYKYGLLPTRSRQKKRFFKSHLLMLIHLIMIVKSSTIIFSKSLNEEGAILIGDFHYFYGPKSARYYLNMTYLALSVYSLATLLVPKVRQLSGKRNNFRWLQFFDRMKHGSLHEISDEKYDHLYKISKMMLGFLDTAWICPFIYASLWSYLYNSQLSFLQFLFFGIFWSVHFIIASISCGHVVYTQTIYFFILCQYVKLLLVLTQRKLNVMNSTSRIHDCKVILTRGFVFRALKHSIQTLQSAFTEIRNCDSYFGQVLRFLLSCCVAAVVTGLYPLLYFDSLSQVCQSTVIILSGIGIATAFFFSAAIVSVEIKKCYKALYVQTLNQTNLRLKWHCLLMLELISSKRNKIGFHVKHWFTLNKMNYVKVNTCIRNKNILTKFTKFILSRVSLPHHLYFS